MKWIERETNLGEILIDKPTFCSHLNIFMANGDEDGNDDNNCDTIIDDRLLVRMKLHGDILIKDK